MTTNPNRCTPCLERAHRHCTGGRCGCPHTTDDEPCMCGTDFTCMAREHDTGCRMCGHAEPVHVRGHACACGCGPETP